MTGKEIRKVLDGEAWIEYDSNWYEYIGETFDGDHIFADVVSGNEINVSDKALRQSTEFFFTEKC